MTAIDTSTDLNEEFLIGLSRGFGVALGIYGAYRLMIWARDGEPVPTPPTDDDRTHYQQPLAGDSTTTEEYPTIEVDEDDQDDDQDADAAEEEETDQ